MTRLIMGKYVVRYKNAKVRGMAKKSDIKRQQMMSQDEGMADEEMDVEEPKPKGKPFQPEKKVVANMLGKQEGMPPEPKKKAKKELGEKGSSKSGNYGHVGRAGKVGGSAPKGSGAGVGGASPAPVKSEAFYSRSSGFPVINTNGLPKVRKLEDNKWTVSSTDSVEHIERRVAESGFEVVGKGTTDDLGGGFSRSTVTFRDPNKQSGSGRTVDQAKADYIKAHPESVAAHQAAGKPIASQQRVYQSVGEMRLATEARNKPIPQQTADQIRASNSLDAARQAGGTSKPVSLKDANDPGLRSMIDEHSGTFVSGRLRTSSQRQEAYDAYKKLNGALEKGQIRSYRLYIADAGKDTFRQADVIKRNGLRDTASWSDVDLLLK